MTNDEEKINKRFPPTKSTSTVQKSEDQANKPFSENSFAKADNSSQKTDKASSEKADPKGQLPNVRSVKFDRKKTTVVSSKDIKSEKNR